MNEIKTFTINEENCLKSINNIDYGTNLFDFDTEEAFEMFKKSINNINIIKGFDVLKAASEGDHLKVVYTERGEKVPQLTMNDISMELFADRAVREKELVQFSIHPKLNKVAKRIAFEVGVKFASSFGISVFDGRDKKISASRLIQDAHIEGKDVLELSTQAYNSATIRSYVSNLNSATGKEIKVTVKDSIIKIHFNGLSRAFQIEKQLSELYSVACNDLGSAAAIKMIEGFAKNERERSVFYSNMHNEYNEAVSPNTEEEEKRRILEEWENEEKETTTATIGDGDDSGPVWEEVDDMKQIIIPGLNMESFTNETQRIFEARLEDQIKSDAPKLPEDGDF